MRLTALLYPYFQTPSILPYTFKEKNGVEIKELKDVIISRNLQRGIWQDLTAVYDSYWDAFEGRTEGRGEPCPFCGGTNRFKLKENKDNPREIVAFCRQKCFDGKHTADLFTAIQKSHNTDKSGAKKMVEDWLIQRGYIAGTKRGATIPQTIPADAAEHDPHDPADPTDGRNMIPPIRATIPQATPGARYYWRLGDDGGILVEVRTETADGKKIFQRRYAAGTFSDPGKGAAGVYIAGAATSEPEPPADFKRRISDLWSDAKKSADVYIVEGCKKAEFLRVATGAPVLTLGSSTNSTATNWATIAARLNQGSRIVIFADNDKPGRKAATGALEAFNAAGFKKLYTVEFAKHEPTAEFSGIDDSYDVANWIEEGRDVSTLLDASNGYIHGFSFFSLHSDAIIQAAEARRGDLEEWALVSGEGEITSEEARENDRFKAILDDMPEPFIKTIKECATGFDVNMILVASTEMTFWGGWIGRNRARMRVRGREVDTLVHTAGVGDSGTGKSPLMDMLAEPILDIQRNERARNGAARKRLFYLEKDLEKLTKERSEILKGGDGEALKEIEKKIDAKKEVIDALKAAPQTYIQSVASPQGVITKLDRNAKAARAQKRNPPGSIIYTSEGQRVYGARLGSRQTADEWGIWNGISEGGINNAETKDDAIKDKEYSYSAGICVSIQGTSCNWIRDKELIGNGFTNRSNWVYLDYRYGVNPNYADPDNLGARRRLLEASYEWQGATFYASDELDAAYREWLKENKLRADEYRRRGDKAGAAFLRKNEKQVLRIALNLHIARQFWELVKNDTRDFTQWRRLGRRERLQDAPELLKELETAENYDATKYDAKSGETFPGSRTNWNPIITADERAQTNPRLIVPLEEFELACRIVKELEIERGRCLGIVVYETDKTKEIRLDNYADAVQTILGKAEEKAKERYEIPADLDAETLERLNELKVKGVHVATRRELAQGCRRYKTKTNQERIDAELAARGLALNLGPRIAFIEYAE